MEWNEKQENILDAAEDLFARKGFIGTTVREIANSAKVNVAMISYYFGSKEKLLQSLLLDRTENSRAMLNDLKKDVHIDPWKKIDTIIDFFVDHILDHRKFHTIITRQISLVQDDESIKLLIDIKKTNQNFIREIIEEGQRKKTFRKVNIPLTIGSVMGTISQVSMSQPFYKTLLGVKKEEVYFRRLRPTLKTHLKSLVRNHLSRKD